MSPDGRRGKRQGWWMTMLKLLFLPRRHRSFTRQGGLLILKAFLAFLLIVPGGTPALAKSAEKPLTDEKVMDREVTGDIMHVSKRAISLEISASKTESNEMLLPVDEATTLERLTSLAELKPGDRVTVVYQQTYRDVETKPVLLKTVALNVALMRRAPPKGTLQSVTSSSRGGE